MLSCLGKLDEGYCVIWVPVTCRDKDVSKDDEGRQEEAASLTDPPPQVTEHSKGQKFGRKVDSSKNHLHQIDAHLEITTNRTQFLSGSKRQTD